MQTVQGFYTMTQTNKQKGIDMKRGLDVENNSQTLIKVNKMAKEMAANIKSASWRSTMHQSLIVSSTTGRLSTQ